VAARYRSTRCVPQAGVAEVHTHIGRSYHEGSFASNYAVASCQSQAQSENLFVVFRVLQEKADIDLGARVMTCGFTHVG
jgi:hypothetical protein